MHGVRIIVFVTVKVRGGVRVIIFVRVGVGDGVRVIVLFVLLQ